MKSSLFLRELEELEAIKEAEEAALAEAEAAAAEAAAEAAAGEAPVSDISFLSKMCPLRQKFVGTIFVTSVSNA